MTETMNNPVKILLVQTIKLNLGDSVLSDCDAYLLQKCFGKREYKIFRYSISSRDIGQVRYVDAVIFAGGIFKVSNEKFWLYIPELLREADRLGVPVFFSAIGVEAYYPDDERSVELREALNLPCVKGISVRDDILTLRRDYITNPDIHISSVYDPAVWCKKVYAEALEDNDPEKKLLIGVGIAREKLFEDYGHPEVTKEVQMEFWLGVIAELEKRKMPWMLFTNGDHGDEMMADEVLAAVGHGDKAPAPADSTELVRMISGFSAVFAARMHSNIIAYALGIPSVGIIWNQKLRFWGKKIGCPERFFETDEMDPAVMVQTLENALSGHAKKPSFFKKQGVYRALRQFVRKYCQVRPDRAHETLPVHERMVATALGGIDKRCRNTNSRAALQYSLDHGYRNFELDLRLTSDEILVCVNRWHRDTYKMFDLPVGEEVNFPALSLQEFQNVCSYRRFPTMTFHEFVTFASPLFGGSGRRLILSVGRPSEAQLSVMLKQLKDELKNSMMNLKDLFLRVERRKDAEAVKAAGLQISLVFYIIPPKDQEAEDLAAFIRKQLAFCTKQKISLAALSEQYYDSETADLFQEAGVAPVVFTYIQTERILEALRSGAFAASHFYDPDYISDLIS